MGSEIFFSVLYQTKKYVVSQNVAAMVSMFTCTRIIVLARSGGIK